MTTALLDIEGLQARRGAQIVLSDVRVDVAAGEVCGLLGPNGAGKTTTIAAALGLLVPDAGRVRLFGENPLVTPDVLRARVGLVPERDGLTGWMAAADYLQYWAGLQGRPIQAEDIAMLLEQVGFVAPPRVPSARLSQGMRRRLAVARALVADPELLILDEPTNGLDPRGRRQLLDLLRSLAQRRGVGILLCTHLLEDVERVCDRVTVLTAGRTVAEGQLRELLGRNCSRSPSGSSISGCRLRGELRLDFCCAGVGDVSQPVCGPVLRPCCAVAGRDGRASSDVVGAGRRSGRAGEGACG